MPVNPGEGQKVWVKDRKYFSYSSLIWYCILTKKRMLNNGCVWWIIISAINTNICLFLCLYSFKGGWGVGGKYQAVDIYCSYIEQIQTTTYKNSISNELFMIFPEIQPPGVKWPTLTSLQFTLISPFFPRFT